MRVETALHTCYLSAVRWWKNAICVLLALLWLPATTHCNLERALELSILACGSDEAAHQPHSESDCGLDGCSILEDGLFKTEDTFQINAPAFFLTSLPVCLSLNAIEAGLQMPDPPPRSDFSLAGSSWQFSYRTALPVRAPALLA